LKQRLIWAFAVLFAIASCGEAVTQNDQARILLVGDSLMAANGGVGKAISNSVENELDEQVVDRSVIGARMIYALPISGAAGLNIPKQYRPGKWDWVIVNGGGNDLWLGCACSFCDNKMERLISEDGRKGTIPGFVSQLRQDGAKVLYVGYLRSPGMGSPIEYCKDEGDELERRVDTLAGLDKGVYFLSLADLVPTGDRTYFAIDMIHPSSKASAEIGKRIAALIEGQSNR